METGSGWEGFQLSPRLSRNGRPPLTCLWGGDDQDDFGEHADEDGGDDDFDIGKDVGDYDVNVLRKDT